MKRKRPPPATTTPSPTIKKKPDVLYTPDWINEKACGVSKANLEKVFHFMASRKYTATRDLPGCSCMDAEIRVCCTDNMVGREPLCAKCTHECSECGEPNLELFKSKSGTPVCYTCARYWYDSKKIWWEDDDWIKYNEEQEKKKKADEEESSA